jgi:hypothetical protein
MKDILRDIVTKVEHLGLDTEPIRDLYKLVSNGNFDFSPFTHLISTLSNQLNKYKDFNSQPTPIALMLKQLDKKVKQGATGSLKNTKHLGNTGNLDIEELTSIIQDTVRSLNSNAAQSNNQLVEAINSLNKNVNSIKKKDHYDELDEFNKAEMDGVFINPIDEGKFSTIESSVSIDTKKEDTNIKNKLQRLKNLTKK